MNLYKRSRIQIILWILLTGVSFGFSVNTLPLKVAVPATLTDIAFLALVFYGNYFYIFPRYFNLQSNHGFFLRALLFILFVSCIQFFTNTFFFVKYSTHPPPHGEFRHMFIFFKAFFWLWLVNLISIVFRLNDHIREQMEQARKMKEEKLNTELKLLKAQINPHFLFNALNNIYSLTYSKSETAPESVLKLSQMLRYVIDDCAHERVTLKSEIEYIDNYIAFQRMKSEAEQNITFEHDMIPTDIMIAPMLFIPFIENGFKYSKIEDSADAYVNIRMYLDSGHLNFRIRNSYPESARKPHGGGMGIENVRQRLDIIYGDSYKLDIRKENSEFSVKLGISLQ